MKDYQTGQLRNVVLLSHQGAGKTSLVRVHAARFWRTESCRARRRWEHRGRL